MQTMQFVNYGVYFLFTELRSQIWGWKNLTLVDLLHVRSYEKVF